MIFTPSFGMWIDKTKTVRYVSLLACVLFSGGNVLYATVGLFNRSTIFGVTVRGVRIWMMMLARWIETDFDKIPQFCSLNCLQVLGGSRHSSELRRAL